VHQVGSIYKIIQGRRSTKHKIQSSSPLILKAAIERDCQHVSTSCSSRPISFRFI